VLFLLNTHKKGHKQQNLRTFLHLISKISAILKINTGLQH